MTELTARMIEVEEKAKRFMAGLIERLSRPFEPHQVKWRVGRTNKKQNEAKGLKKATRGMALAYIDSRDIMKRLDDEVGAGNWKDELVCSDGRWICTIYLRLPLEPYHLGEWGWVGKTDAAGETDVEPAKGGASDAFKRACVKWGPGRSLYDLDSPWVDLNDFGNGIAEHEQQRLDNLIRGIGDPNLSTEEPTAEEPVKVAARPAPAPDKEKPGSRITEAQRKLLYKTNFACAEKAKIDTKNDKERAFECINYAVEKLGHKKVEEVGKDEVSKAIHFMNEWLNQQKDEARHPVASEEAPPDDGPTDDDIPPPDDSEQPF